MSCSLENIPNKEIQQNSDKSTNQLHCENNKFLPTQNSNTLICDISDVVSVNHIFWVQMYRNYFLGVPGY